MFDVMNAEFIQDRFKTGEYFAVMTEVQLGIVKKQDFAIP